MFIIMYPKNLKFVIQIGFTTYILKQYGGQSKKNKYLKGEKHVDYI